MLQSLTTRKMISWGAFWLACEFFACYAIVYFFSSSADDKIFSSFILLGILYAFRILNGIINAAISTIVYYVEKSSRVDKTVALFYLKKLPIIEAMVHNDGAAYVFEQLAKDATLPIDVRQFASETLGGLAGMRQAQRFVMFLQAQAVIEAALARYTREQHARTSVQPIEGGQT
jgi:hypothetical protein